MTQAAPIYAAQRRAQLTEAPLTRGARRYAEWVESAYPGGTCDLPQAELAERWGITERHVRRLEGELVRAGVWTLERCRTRGLRVRVYPARRCGEDIVAAQIAQQLAGAPVDNSWKAPVAETEAQDKGLRLVGTTGHARPVTPGNVRAASGAQDIHVLSPRGTGPLPPHTPPSQLAVGVKIPSSRDTRTHEAPGENTQGQLAPASQPERAEPSPALPAQTAPRPMRLTAAVLARELGLALGLEPAGTQGHAAAALAQVGLDAAGRLEVLTALAPGAADLHELRQRATSAAAWGVSRAAKNPAGLLRCGARDGWLLGRVEGHSGTVRLGPILEPSRASCVVPPWGSLRGEGEELAGGQVRGRRGVRGEGRAKCERYGRNRRKERPKLPKRAKLPPGMSDSQELFGAALTGITGKRARRVW
ncbi:MAG: hypothetical protein GC161_18310 [Planctomycetaceae bacterium]|nr:hypothetical protein [Planctomycetaceae bacterium]